MRILIEINCESIGELGSHLNEMFKQVKKECKKQKLDAYNDEFPEGTILEDDNCYGSHELKIVPEPL